MQAETTHLSESLGDYLESIYHLIQANGAARTKDISVQMKVKMSSVTGALRALTERNLINYNPYSLVTLTEHGEQVAQDLVLRHETLARFFREVLELDNDAAERNACHMEHAIEPEALARLVSFLDNAAKEK